MIIDESRAETLLAGAMQAAGASYPGYRD